MRKNNQGFIQIILVLILVALVGGGMYYFGKMSNKSNVVVETPTEEPGVSTVKPTSDPTAGWKTYTNTNLGFSLKYPSNWVIKNEAVYKTLPRIDTFDTKISTGLKMELPSSEFFVNYHENISDIDAWLTQNYMGAKIANTKNINGKEFKIVNGGTQYQSREYILSLGQGRFLRFVIEPVKDSQIGEVDNYFDQILSTFKFTK